MFAITVGVYTTIGGFRAVVVTDAVQGIMMIIGTIANGARSSIAELMFAWYTPFQIKWSDLITPYGPDNFSQPTVYAEL